MIVLALFVVLVISVFVAIVKRISQYVFLRRKLASLPGPKNVLFTGFSDQMSRIPAEGKTKKPKSHSKHY